MIASFAVILMDQVYDFVIVIGYFKIQGIVGHNVKRSFTFTQ